MSASPPERIFRYQLEITDSAAVSMPHGARVLSVAPERNPGERGERHLDVWALVDPTVLHVEHRQFRIVGTGNPMPADCGRFIGTAITHHGALVWHVFEARTTAVKEGETS